MELKQGDDKSKWIVRSNHNIKCFTEGEIVRMTSNYKTIIGRGAFGEVYRGLLEDNSVVAVKKLVDNVRENFDQELIVHREINHKNVVRLIGYCVGENALILVTEYIPNGNLNVILHSNNSIPISLETRLRIATECAEALAYMHSYMYTQVIHGDIKPANILLDGNLKAQISDFGISRLVNNPDKTLLTKNVIGSIGYMDPLFVRDGRLTVKSDVYSFGVVLVELITMKKATTFGDEANIVYVFSSGVKGVREIFDAQIASKDNMKLLLGVAKLASECLQMERDRRPQMIDVVERLRTLGRANSHQGLQRDLFSWIRKSKPTLPKPPYLPPYIPPLQPLASAAATTPVKTWLSSKPCRRFSLEDMLAATSNFHESLLVNKGVFGTRVYCGEIDGGATKVAITRPRYSHTTGLEFRSAIERRSKLRHDHIAPLIGYCNESHEKILVYHFRVMAHGSLYEHLYRTQGPRLTWMQRLDICIGAARGLHYFHGGAEHAIIHGNLHPRNILLDGDWVAKITDDFSSKIASDRRFSSYCILDPDHQTRAFYLTKESDVYGFGALLFEVLCAKADRTLPMEYMLESALRYKEEGKLDRFFDPALKGDIKLQSLNKFAEIAAKCVAAKAIDRPPMEDVVSDLERALQLQISGESSVSGS